MPALLNPHVTRTAPGLFSGEEYQAVAEYFGACGLPPTPLRSLDALAHALALGALDVKDESARFGLNAFKITGVSYALHRLTASADAVVCATAGNHGRAVARAARDRGLRCTVFIPVLRTASPLERQTRSQRIDGMRRDGAEIIEVDGTYEEAVERAAAFAKDSGATIVSDTSWDGYETIPRWIMAGYTRLFDEAERQWQAPPDVVVVQGGVGGLVCAAASWFAWRFGAQRPFMIACEPENAACLLESARAGRPVTIDSNLDTIMAGLRCATPSPVAWPAIANGIDAFMTVDDDDVVKMISMVRALPPDQRLDAGPSGACGLAAIAALMQHDELRDVRVAARMDRSTRVLAVVTEGA